MDRIIKALPKNIADKIAAGEVVERPLSIVKELLENSVDAGATSVTIEIEKGGKEYIRVTDNGCGIERLQLELAFKRYATSKIATEDDLNSIETLGFRGEALASIASVSKVKLISKTRSNPVGASIELSEGESLGVNDSASEDGTTIIVKDLFFNIPARKKFLKPDNVESSLIIDFVSKMAIAYPDIAIRLISNKSVLFATNGKGDLLANIYTVFGPHISEGLVPVDITDGENSLKGYISSPAQSKNNKKWQIFFVNGRLVKSKVLEDAVSKAYHDKLFEGHYPICFLFLETNPKALDVNIHPHKTEIRFYDEEETKDFMVKSIRSSLLNPDALKANISEKKLEKISSNTQEATIENVIESIVEEEVKIDDYFKSLRKDSEIQEKFELESSNNNSEVITNENHKITREFCFSKLSYIGECFETYLLCKDEDALYIIDQHAAHERVMFEKLWADYNKEANDAQTIITPIVITLSLSSKEAALDKLGELKAIGFEIEDFGPDSFVFKAIPACMDIQEAEIFLNEFFESAAEASFGTKINIDKIISRSCKAAVKAHDRLDKSEINRLLSDLDKCENPFSCPHGRPTFLKLSNYDIERMFKRK